MIRLIRALGEHTLGVALDLEKVGASSAQSKYRQDGEHDVVVLDFPRIGGNRGGYDGYLFGLRFSNDFDLLISC